MCLSFMLVGDYGEANRVKESVGGVECRWMQACRTLTVISRL
jgi:hypothetical protein